MLLSDKEEILTQRTMLPFAMRLDPRCDYNSSTKYGDVLPVVLYFKDYKGDVFPFHISKKSYCELVRGNGRVYGRTPWGPWQKLFVYNYKVRSCENVQNNSILQELDSDLFGSLKINRDIWREYHGEEGYMYEDLWKKQGFDRLTAIDNLNHRDLDFICSFYQKCGHCPLGLSYRDALDVECVMCVDVATRKHVENALKEGGKFIIRGYNK